MKKSVYILFGILLVSLTAGAQVEVALAPSVIASGGEYTEAGNISISWTLGELAVTTLEGGNMVLTQGFQQPFDIGVGIGPEEADWSISVYPNPVKDALRIRFGIAQPEDFLVELQDVTGRVLTLELHRQVLPGEILYLDISGYKEGIYFLKLSTPDRGRMKVTGIRKL
jgi:hypothetical protein